MLNRDHLYVCMGKSVHLAIAGDIFDGVFFAVFFPMRCLG